MDDPKLCYVAVMKGNEYTLGIVKEGETGYYATDYPTVKTMDEADKWANDLNTRMGVSDNDAMVLILLSMRPH